MADQFLQNYKQSFSLADIYPNMEFINHQDHIFMGLPQLSANLESFPSFFVQDPNTALTPFTEPTLLNDHSDKKRKVLYISTPESTSAYSSPQVSDNGSQKTNRAGRGKRVKGNEKEDEKPREVIHVRAKRGQATDSHSLAERVRRRKINERLRCLQDIVPGCYKSMGMAVMLDEIINYVQSLQNQVEFLSMKLTSASAFYDFNSDTDVVEAMERAKAFEYEALKAQNVGSQEGLISAQGAQSGLNFGYCPQLPHSR